MKKILFNTFALIGFVTFILLACSVDELTDSSDNSDNNNNQVTNNNYGKYQVSAYENEGYAGMAVINTETGVTKFHHWYNSQWNEISTITFTH
jgi:outer membrane biogenesis lipoprotein LolB